MRRSSLGVTCEEIEKLASNLRVFGSDLRVFSGSKLWIFCEYVSYSRCIVHWHEQIEYIMIIKYHIDRLKIPVRGRWSRMDTVLSVT